MNSQTTTWQEINRRLDIFLNDDPFKVEVGGEVNDTYPERQRLLAWHDAQRMLVWHTPRQRKTTLTIDRDTRSAILPSDLLDVWRIYDADEQKWLVRHQYQKQGGIRYDDDDLDSFWIWGRTLWLNKEVSVGSQDLTLYYWAYWPEVIYELDDEGDVSLRQEEILVPPWSILPLCHLTAATCFQPGAVQAAEIRTWNIKIDSGVPIQNSRASQAREHLWWWNTLLGSVPRPEGWL